MTPPRFPFVVGCARSGTTLVRAMLDAHPEVAVPGESYFPVWLGRYRQHYEHGTDFDVAAYADGLTADPWFQRWELPRSSVAAALAEAAPSTFADAVRATYRAYADQHGKPRYADKTPAFVLHIDTLAARFGEACFVHVVRDGRDTTLSLLDVEWGPRTFEQAALHWRHHVRAGRRAGRALSPDRYLEVQYEDLTDHAEDAARAICTFVGVAYDAAMLRYFERADQILDGLPDPQDHAKLRERPARRRSWAQDLRRHDIELFAALAGDELAAFGYDAGVARIAPAVRAEALAAKARWHAQAALRHGRTNAWRLLNARRSRP
jgi:hypothetical protein